MFTDPVFSNKLVEYFLKLKDTKEGIRLFGIDRHPLLLEVMQVKGYKDQPVVMENLRNIFEQIIYRQELGIKYESYDTIRKFNEKRSRARKVEEIRGRNKQVVLPTTAEELLLLTSGDHLRAVGQSFGAVTMPDWSLHGMRLETLASDNFIGLHAEEVEDPDAMNLEEDDGDNDDHEPVGDSDDDDVAAKRLKTQHDTAIVPALEAEPVKAPICCFKVLKSQPGRIQSLSTFIHHGGDVIGQSAFAVTMHGCSKETDGLIMDHLPRAAGASGMQEMVVEDFYPGMCLPTLRSSVMGHYNDGANDDGRPTLRLSLPIGDYDALTQMLGSRLIVHDVLTQLLAVRAVPGKEGFVEGSGLDWPWGTLLAQNDVRVLGGDICDESPTSEYVV